MKGKKLFRNQKKGMICGVCAGLADYFEVDVSLIRLAWVIFAFGGGIFAYILAAIIIPTK